MSGFSRSTAVCLPVSRSAAMAALFGAAILATPLAPARADGAARPLQLAQATTPQPTTPQPTTPQQTTPQGAPSQDQANTAAEMKTETVDQRISSLHAALQITPAEEPDWNAVAQAMRDNNATMQKLAQRAHAQNPQTMTAVQDLKTYAMFARAHVAGLKHLTVAFESLYNSMPEAQKKVADQVFDQSRENREAAHG